jgi:uncharacterized protein YfaS (alpha-2-macroglobulin family)
VKVYPGVLAQLVEGLDSILRMPYGCFEQTSSTTYPNVLVLDYLDFTNQFAPEVQFKAEEYINLGYQRSTTFEVGSTGGFTLFGKPPADWMLTAYGLQEFSDISPVYPVDPQLISRAADWLYSQQEANGSWVKDRGLVHENRIDITYEGEGNLMYQVSGSYYLPWEALSRYPQLSGSRNLLDIELDCDRTELSVDESIQVHVTVTLRDGRAESTLIDIGLPPGFEVDSQGLSALVASFDDLPKDYAFPTIERYELTDRQLILYVSNLNADHPLFLTFKLRAKYPLSVHTPGSTAYDYYNSDIHDQVQPLTLLVLE